MKIEYLTWLGDRLGHSEEDLELPKEINNVKDLVAFLSARSGSYESVFSSIEYIKTVKNGRLVQDIEQENLVDEDTLSFFSPLAGG